MARPKEFSLEDGEYFAPAVVPINESGDPSTGAAAIGNVDDLPWGGVGDATVISLLKGIYVQGDLMNTLLGEIATNTQP